MCARFVQRLEEQAVRDLYRVGEADQPPLLARYNGAPAQDFAVCRVEADAPAAGGPRRTIARLRWGFPPAGGEGRRGRHPLINARAESVHLRPAFADAFRHRRCLIPANGWFEWIRAGRERLPYYLASADGALLSFAGIWQPPTAAGPPEDSFAILTTDALPELRRVHDRQPAIVPPAAFADWLDPKTPEARLLELAREPPTGPYEIRPVSVRVNSVANDDPEVLATRPELFSPLTD